MNDKLRQEILKGLKSLLKEQDFDPLGSAAGAVRSFISAQDPIAQNFAQEIQYDPTKDPMYQKLLKAGDEKAAKQQLQRKIAVQQLQLAQQIENLVMKIIGGQPRKIAKVDDIQAIVEKLRAGDKNFPSKQQLPDLTKRLTAITNYIVKNPNNVKIYLTTPVYTKPTRDVEGTLTSSTEVRNAFSGLEQELKNRGDRNAKAHVSSVYDNYFVKTGFTRLSDEAKAIPGALSNAIKKAVDAYLKDFPGSIKESWSTRNKNKYTNNLFERLTRNINK